MPVLIRRTVFFGLFLIVFTPASFAAENIWSGVFLYQQKMANHGRADAQVKLGEMYEEGHGTEQSFDMAEQWYRKALEQGHAPAQAKLDKLQLRRLREAKAAEEAAQAALQRQQEERERLVREKQAKERLAREAEQRRAEERAKQAEQENEAAAAEEERQARLRAAEAMKKMMAAPEAYDEE